MKPLETIQIGLNEEQRTQVIDRLQVALANQHVIYLKLRNFHWNLHGPRFSPLHELFQEQYKVMEKSIDDTAERIRMLGGVPSGSMAEFLQRTKLEEHAGELIHGENAIEELVRDREEVIRLTRESIDAILELGDEGTADMLIAQIRGHEEVAWMLRSFL